MQMPELELNVSYEGKGGEIVVISGTGYVDSSTYGRLEEELRAQVALKKYKLIVDLKKISYINSAGWGALLREIKELRDHKGDLVLANMTPEVYDIYEKMEFSSLIKSFPNLKAALSYFTK